MVHFMVVRQVSMAVWMQRWIEQRLGGGFNRFVQRSKRAAGS